MPSFLFMCPPGALPVCFLAEAQDNTTPIPGLATLMTPEGRVEIYLNFTGRQAIFLKTGDPSMIATASKPIRKRRQTRARRCTFKNAYTRFFRKVQYGPNLYAGYYAQWLLNDSAGLAAENCFAHCFGKGGTWNPQPSTMKYLYNRTTGRLMESIICSDVTTANQRIHNAILAEGYKETQERDCECGEKICTYNYQQPCLKVNLATMPKVKLEIGGKEIVVPWISQADYDAAVGSAPIAQHCIKCDSNPPEYYDRWTQVLPSKDGTIPPVQTVPGTAYGPGFGGPPPQTVNGMTLSKCYEKK